jgi:hypothetical protein
MVVFGANNPVAVAVVEAIGILNWERDSLQVLSIGCTSTPLNVSWGQRFSLGFAYWGIKLADVFLRAQSSGAFGMAQHLLSNRNNIVRICPEVSPRFGLDTVREINSLRALGDSEARKALPQIRPRFFMTPADIFVPYRH